MRIGANLERIRYSPVSCIATQGIVTLWLKPVVKSGPTFIYIYLYSHGENN
jgi:hypothetical protein